MNARPIRSFVVTPGVISAAVFALSCASQTTDHLLSIDEVPALELVEELRVGSVADPEVGFSSIGDVWLAPSGEIYVEESREREVRVYDAEGVFVRSYGRQGDGPGEFRSIAAFGVLGDTVWVSDGSRPRLTLFNRAGEVLSTVSGSLEVPIGQSMGRELTLTVYPRELRPNGLIVSGFNAFRYPNLPDSVALVPRVLFDLDGNIADTLEMVRVSVSFPARSIDAETSTGGRVTSIIAIEPPAYDSGTYKVRFEADTVALHWSVTESPLGGVLRATRTNSSGETVELTRFRYEPRPVEDSYLDSIAAARAGGMRISTSDSVAVVRATREAMRMPPHHRPIRTAQAGNDGSTWIALNETDASANRWLVLGADGNAVGLLDLPERAQLRHREESRVWVVERDELDVPWLVRYRIEKRGDVRGS